MAKKRAEKKQEEPASPEKTLLKRVRERVKLMMEDPSEQSNRRAGVEDLKFVNVPGHQWNERMKTDRGDRPCYEFNRLRISCKRVINDMKANRAAIKVRGTEDGDKKTADINEGIIRNIWAVSDADSVVDYQAEYQVGAGMCAWRVNTKYISDKAFDQDIVIEGFENPIGAVWCDPSAKDPCKRDADDWVVVDRMSRAAYERRWPKRDVVSWESSEFEDDHEWMMDEGESVRVVEYWYKELYDEEIWQLTDGRVVEAKAEGSDQIDPSTIRRKRVVKCNRIKMCIASGEAILEQSDWAGSMFPFVMVYGEFISIDGKRHWCGLPRYSKDAQQAFNVANTAVIEKTAAAPDAKFWATADQAKGHTAKWAEAHTKKFPFMLYNPDPKAPGPPVSMGSDPVPVALIQVAAMAAEEIKATTGIFDASLGQEANEKSGRAIIARQQQGEIATFNFPDNMKKGIGRTGEILIDLIPKVIDTERQLRILGADLSEDYVTVNQVVQDQATGKPVTINDLSRGQFDVAVTTGPSFTTRRQEATELYTQLAQSDPMLMPTAGDLVYKSMDVPYAEEIAERRRAMLPPPIQQMLNQGKDIPPEAKAVMAQAAQAMEMVEQKNQLVMAAAQELQQEQGEVEKGKSELDQKMAELQTAKAQFEAFVAKQMAALTQKEAQLQVSAAQAKSEVEKQGVENERAQLQTAAQGAVHQIQQMAQQLLQAQQQLSERVEREIAMLMQGAPA